MTIRTFQCAIAAAALACIAQPAAAQIVPCTGINQPGYKLLLDDIVLSGPGAQNLLQALVHRVEANIEQVRTEAGQPLMVVACVNRRPRGPGDFDKTRLEQLNARQVVMEVWASAAEAKDENGDPYTEATVGYLLVPVRYQEFESGRPTAAFTLPHRAKSLAGPDELVRAVDQAGRLAGYTAVAWGAKLLRNRGWDEARRQLCRAESFFVSLGDRRATNDQALLDYTRKLAADAVTGARADAGYSGPLKLSNLKLACPGQQP
jgi:hypothetical protein